MCLTLEDFPIELIEIVVTYLELDDSKALRLTSRTLEEKASKGYFATFFKHKRVELTTENLSKMVQVTSKGRPGSCLQHCTIIGIARSGESKGAEEEEEQSCLLAEAFHNLKQRSENGWLTSLDLSITALPVWNSETCKDQFRSWRTVWDTAASTFRITTGALRQSQLRVHEHLNVFGNVNGCSLGYDVFRAFLPVLASNHVLQCLKRLTLSLSAPANDSLSHDDTDFATVSTSQPSHSTAALQDMSWLLRVMPDIESFDLHWYSIGGVKPASPSPVTSRKDNSTTTSLPAVSLRECTLRGVYTSEDALIQLLKVIRPERLTLKHTRLGSGSAYRQVFEYLTSSQCSVAAYELLDLHEAYSLVHFEHTPGTPPLPYLCESMEPSKLTRTTDQSKEVIHYRLPIHRALSSPHMRKWRTIKAREYGRPYESRYDFVNLNKPLGDD